MMVFDLAVVFTLLQAMGHVPSSGEKVRRTFPDVYISYADSRHYAVLFSETRVTIAQIALRYFLWHS